MNKLKTILLAIYLSLKSFSKSFKEDTRAMVDLGVILMIGIAFAALVVVAFIIWTIRGQLLTHGGHAPGSSEWPWSTTSDAVNASMNTTYWAQNASRSSIANVTGGFDNAVNLLLVAIFQRVIALKGINHFHIGNRYSCTYDA